MDADLPKKKKKTKTATTAASDKEPQNVGDPTISKKKRKKKKKTIVVEPQDSDSNTLSSSNDSDNTLSLSSKSAKAKKPVQKTAQSENASRVDSHSHSQRDDDNDCSNTVDAERKKGNKNHPKKKIPQETSSVENEKCNGECRGGRQPLKNAPQSTRIGTTIREDRLASASSFSVLGDNDPADSSNCASGRGYAVDLEDEEDEHRWKYSTADLEELDCRSTNCCLIGAGICFIFLVLGISMAMAKVIPDYRRLQQVSSRPNSKLLRGTETWRH